MANDENGKQGQDFLMGLLKAAGVPLPKPYEKVDVEIERQGKKIVLPDDPKDMEIPEAITHLQRIQKDEQQVFALNEVIEAHPYDALVAFNKAMRDLYGWTSPIPKPGFFPQPPDMITVQLSHDPNDTMQVPIGHFQIPSVEHPISVSIARTAKGRFGLHVQGRARRVEKAFLLELVNRARKFVREESIYRGKALAATVHRGELQQELKFFDTSGVAKEQVILNRDVEEQIAVNLWAPVENTAACRKHKVPLKRGVLLEGKFGTGKSLTALVTAKVCADNGWTFLNIDNVNGLADALLFAEQYAPCVVFAEDIDRVLSERDNAANTLVNVLDGVLTKRAEVITVLTTNHVDKIDPVMLRPGRLDAVITIAAPDRTTVKRLIHVYGAGLVDPKADLDPVCFALAGQIPATVREVVERSKLAMIARGEHKVSGDSLLIAAKGMMATHLKLLNQPRQERSAAEKLWDAMRAVVEMNTDDLVTEEQLDAARAGINENTDDEAGATRTDVEEKAETIMETLSEMAEDVTRIKRAVV